MGAVVILAPTSGPILSPAACNRKIPIFDGYTRFDINLTYVGERTGQGEGLRGSRRRVRCALRADLRAQREPACDQFMADNKDLEVWLAPIPSEHVLVPFRVSARTMVGTTVIEASSSDRAGVGCREAPATPSLIF